MSDTYRHTGEYMNIHQLRKMAEQELIDYQFLVSALGDYSRPRDKISTWLKTGALIRVKKGLYVFGEEAAIVPYSKEQIANLIYGPSAISLQYALSYYQLIPERVTTVTSITNKRNKSFSTPIGHFTYSYLSHSKYRVGIEVATLPSNIHFFIASPEKALCDQIHITDKNIKLSSLEEVKGYLAADLRIDMTQLDKFRINKLNEIGKLYRDERINALIKFIKFWKKTHA